MSVLNFDSFNDIASDYDPLKNKSRNIMTCYERTNVIGFRLEQLAFGARPLLEMSDIENCETIRDIAKMELVKNLLPFIICRNMPNNGKEYWKLRDMIILDQ
jgi:DNA-directed RNA polymerase subunit K/omega